MPVPSPRNKILPARGNFSDLNANVASLLDGEICYAIDQDQYYQNEGGTLVSVGATKAQGALADTSVQPGDNVSDLVNDAGYITLAEVPAVPVDSVNGQTGVVVLDADDIDDTSTFNKFATAAQLSLADTSVQPGDNVSDLSNDAGYITLAQVPGDAVTSVNTQTGAVVLDTDGIAEGSTNLYSQWDNVTGGIEYMGGNAFIGGTNGSPNISLKADGSATFVGTVNGRDMVADGIKLDSLGGGGGAVDIQEFTTSGTWTKPAGANTVYVEVISGGGGGGGGSEDGGTASERGGGGGASGMQLSRWYEASSLGSTETITVGAGGAGGGARIDGAGGGDSLFGSHITARGGNGGDRGGGGTTSGGGGGSRWLRVYIGSSSEDRYALSVGGGTSLATTAEGGAYNIYGPGAGGAGGPASSGVAYPGAEGGLGYAAYFDVFNNLNGGGPAGGAINGANGTSGASGTGSGGGGGGGDASGGVAGQGGNGGFPGGGGGGGGASNNNASGGGTGGDGADGVVRVYTYF